MELATYCPDDVSVLVAGFLKLDGFIDGTFINVSKNLQPFSSRRTSDGTVSRLYNNDQTYTVQITVHSGSRTNDILTKLSQIDEITQKGKFPLLIKDHSGTDLFFSTSTWIEQYPDMAKSAGIDERIWVLRSSQAFINVGGNQDASSLLRDLVNIASSAAPILNGIV